MKLFVGIFALILLAFAGTSALSMELSTIKAEPSYVSQKAKAKHIWDMAVEVASSISKLDKPKFANDLFFVASSTFAISRENAQMKKRKLLHSYQMLPNFKQYRMRQFHKLV